MSDNKLTYIEGDWVFDKETYPNCYTVTFLKCANPEKIKTFEISTRKNETKELFDVLCWFKKNKQRLVGFNNLGFDYPILHEMIQVMKRELKRNPDWQYTAEEIYDLAQVQVNSFKDSGFGNTIKEKDILIPQVDLYKIHHFDNRAKATSLKMLEFNMRSPNVEDLPFPVGTELTDEEMDVLVKYNQHDVKETYKFYVHSLDLIRLRADLSVKYGIDFTNFNDTKIGKEYFINRLEEAIPGSCYKVDGRGFKKINQTKRPVIDLSQCLFNYIKFDEPAFKAVQGWFSKQRIRETKGVFTEIPEHRLGSVADFAVMEVKRKKFACDQDGPTEQQRAVFFTEYPKGWIEEETLKGTFTVKNPDGTKTKVNKKSYWKCWREASNLNVVVNGFRFDFGTGGIHGSLTDCIIRSGDGKVIKDADVASMYPNLGISNRIYPEHLTNKFCDIYQAVYELRKSYAKGTPENAVMKLALNGVYGDSNNEYSPFYDPKYTMAITVGGQLTICMLAERLIRIDGLELIQVNTDGITVLLPEDKIQEYNDICNDWVKEVKLELEFADYSAMYIRDVNNYIAQYTNGKVKRKGAYQYEGLGWHQNHSALIIQKAAEAHMLYGKDILEFIRACSDPYDFCLRAKIPRSSKLYLRKEGVDNEGKVCYSDTQQQNLCRYYPSTSSESGKLIKVMPALAGKEDNGPRELSIDKEWNVKICNDMRNFSFDDLDYKYYVKEAEKLIVGVGNAIDTELEDEDD